MYAAIDYQTCVAFCITCGVPIDDNPTVDFESNMVSDDIEDNDTGSGTHMFRIKSQIQMWTGFMTTGTQTLTSTWTTNTAHLLSLRIRERYCHTWQSGCWIPEIASQVKPSFPWKDANHGPTSRKFNLMIQSYQADNSGLAEAAFMVSILWSQCTISKCCRQMLHSSALGYKARTIMVHVHHRWSLDIDAHLWPYALRVVRRSVIHPVVWRLRNLTKYEILSTFRMSKICVGWQDAIWKQATKVRN